jgi:hypothetical protein
VHISDDEKYIIISHYQLFSCILVLPWLNEEAAI